jgi:choline dehydrogenase-like flavoprotein
MVRTGAEVNKLISKKVEGQDLQVVGVEYSSSGTVSRAMVNKEVVMSAGAIGTPAILERSGIGKPSIIKSLNIPVTLDLPAVGSNLADHPALLGTYRLKSGIVSSDDLLRNATFAAEQTALYMNTGGGLLSHGISLLDYQTLKSILTPEELFAGLKLLQRDPATMSQEQFNAISERIQNGVAVEFLLINAFFVSEFSSILGARQCPLT